MKRKWVLSKEELNLAVAQYVEKQANLEKETEVQIYFHIQPNEDYGGRLTGGHSVTASVSEK